MVHIFEEWNEHIDAELKNVAKVAVEDVLKLKEGERVLIVTNPHPDGQYISQALYDAVEKVGGLGILLTQETKSQLDFADPAVIQALHSEPDVALSISKEKLGKDRRAIKEGINVGERKYDHVFNYLLGENKMRSFWSPSVTLDMFKRTVPVDYEEMGAKAARLKEILDKADKVRVVTDNGCDINVHIEGRKAKKDDGNFSEPGSGGNLPAGETFISPAIAKSQGTIVFDGCISVADGVVIIDEPITCDVRDGFVREIKGGEEADKLRETIEKSVTLAGDMQRKDELQLETAEEYKRNAYHLGELGIGLNPNANIVGNMLEDEKVLGTCHIAIGSNYDEDAKALIHLDGLINSPDMTAVMPDGSETEIMKKGRFSV